MEIDKGGLGRLFIDDFHRCLKKACAKTAPAFFTVATGPTTIKITIGNWECKRRSAAQSNSNQETALTQNSGHRP
jgi:hypothetical protein